MVKIFLVVLLLSAILTINKANGALIVGGVTPVDLTDPVAYQSVLFYAKFAATAVTGLTGDNYSFIFNSVQQQVVAGIQYSIDAYLINNNCPANCVSLRCIFNVQSQLWDPDQPISLFGVNSCQ
jgi:hypothetical protein